VNEPAMKTFYRSVANPAPPVALVFPEFGVAAATGDKNSLVEGLSFRFQGLDESVPQAIAFVIDTSRARSGRSVAWIMTLI
jgi:hypothetical protein